jgi:mono/diheme cytochrome c family protein
MTCTSKEFRPRTLNRLFSRLPFVLGLFTFSAFSHAGELGNRSGAEIYTKVCALCHETRVGPSITGRQLHSEAVKIFVRHGSNGMPAFRPSEISPAELEAIAQFIMTSPVREEASK